MSKALPFPHIFTINRDCLLPFFSFINKAFINCNKDILIDFSSVKNKHLSNGIKLILHAYAEKHFLIKKKMVYAKNTPKDLHDLSFRRVKLNNKVRNIGNVTQLPASSLNFSVINDLMGSLKKIGIDTKNQQYSEKYERVKAVITEIFANAIEHGIKEKDLNIWITTEKDNADNKIYFTFVDLGIGIAHSHKKARLIYKICKDSYIVKRSLQGKIPSSTREVNRGKGLPEILDTIKDSLIDDFILVSNKAAIFYNEEEICTRDIPLFSGTYFSWSVRK